MHQSVMDFVSKVVRPEHVQGLTVLEVGSYDVNGSVRPGLEALGPAEYIGTDMREGPRVDRVLDATQLVTEFGADRFDAVICCEMLEHCWDWRRAINQMKTVLKPGGLLVLTTRSPGFPLHDHPSDHWRFTTGDMGQIMADLDGLVVEADPQVAGVFSAGIKNGKPRTDLYRIVVGGVS